MKAFVFPYSISFGRWDDKDGTITCELTEKEGKRLIQSAEMGGRLRLEEDEDIKDIYDKVLLAICDEEKKALLADPDFIPVPDDEDEAEEWENMTVEEQIDEYLFSLEIFIYYPEHLQSLEQTFFPKNPKLKFETVLIPREELPKDEPGARDADKVIYTDGGKTLYAVPMKYSGRFTIPSQAKELDWKAFWRHAKITEVVFEDDSIEEIPERAFSECTSLQKAAVSGSVKKICDNAFSQCEKLNCVVLAEGIIEIEPTAFRLCSKLRELHIPATVETLDLSIISYWNGLENLFFEGTHTKITKGFDCSTRGLTLYVKPGSSAEEYAIQNEESYLFF